MTPNPDELLPEVEQAGDPYHLTPDGIKEPPKGWGPSLRYFGRGLILSASIVGSGELIATTTLGAQAGFAILWLVVFSTLVKVAVQVELARWTISTGEPALTGYNKVPPRFGRITISSMPRGSTPSALVTTLDGRLPKICFPGNPVDGTYGARKYTAASIPIATRATKIRAPATALSPVSR
jgi:hypothetical protein